MNGKCGICGCEHESLIRTGILYLHGSEDDYICERCRLEIAHFARSLQAVAYKVNLYTIAKLRKGADNMDYQVEQTLKDRQAHNKCAVCGEEITLNRDYILFVHAVVGEVLVHTKHIK